MTITHTGSLEIGILVADRHHLAFTLRQAVLADAYAAAAAIAVPDDIDSNASARVAYQMAIDDATILAQLTALGSLEAVPSIAALAGSLDPDDMAILRQAAAELKKKLRQSRASSPPTGEPNTSLSAPASP